MLLQALHDKLTPRRINEKAELIHKATVPVLKFVHAATGNEREAIPCTVRLKSSAVVSTP